MLLCNAVLVFSLCLLMASLAVADGWRGPLPAQGWGQEQSNSVWGRQVWMWDPHHVAIPTRGLVAPAEQCLFHQKLLIIDLHYHGF